jgi:E3 ubiquitin-protein ligase MUL1
MITSNCQLTSFEILFYCQIISDLEVISDKFEPMTSSFFDHMWGFFSGVRQRGLQTIEEMLRDKTRVTGIGELKRENGILRLQTPKSGLPLYITSSTKTSLLKRMQESKDTLR